MIKSNPNERVTTRPASVYMGRDVTLRPVFISLADPDRVIRFLEPGQN